MPTMKVLYRMNEFQAASLPVFEEKWGRTTVVGQIQSWINLSIDPDEPIQGLSYVKDWIPDISVPESDKFVIGAERPEHIKRIAHEWNRSLIRDLSRQLHLIEDAAKKNGFSSLSEFADSSPSAFARDELGNSSWDALANAISMVNNHFVYGGDKIIFWHGDWTMTNDWMLNDIDEHLVERRNHYELYFEGAFSFDRVSENDTPSHRSNMGSNPCSQSASLLV